MMYYITVDGVYKYMTMDVTDVNNWLLANNKQIKSIFVKDWNKAVFIEVK